MNLIAVIKPFVLKTGRALVRNSNHILMGMGTVASVSAAVMAAKATPEAVAAIREEEFERRTQYLGESGQHVIEIEDLTAKEKPKIGWKYYIPAGIMELVSLACFWGAHGIDMRRQAVLAGLCTTAEEALRDYQRQVKDLIGDKAEHEVKQAQAQEEADRHLLDTVPEPDKESHEMFIYNDQIFYSCYNDIKEAQNMANHEMIQNMYISEAELIWLLDPGKRYLHPEEDSGQIGWSVDRLIFLHIYWGDGPNHQRVGIVKVEDKDGFRYLPQAGFSKML